MIGRLSIFFLVAFLSLFIISDTSAEKNHVVRNGKFGVLRHGTFPSPPLGEFTHVGVDIVAPCGSYIYAFSNGQVKDVIDNTNDKDYKTLGYMVLIEHPASLIGKKLYTLYLHMQDSPEVGTGDQVIGGSTVIGKVGDTGNAFGCHTHFEIRYFPERFSTWGNIYGPGDQRTSEYFKQNWENSLTFIRKYPNGLKLTQSSGRENNTVKVETDKDNQEKQNSGIGSDTRTGVDSNEGVYVGDLKDGKKHGWGTYNWANGDKYNGEWKDDKMHGQGTQTFPNGNKYVGEWKDDNKHGQGTFTWSNGEVYVGEWKDDKRTGQGTHTWPAGNKYVGGFMDSKKHGQGTMTWSDGEKYMGGYKDGKEHGQGTYTWYNGDKYVGEWKDGKQHGQGTQTFGSASEWAGEKYVGEFKDGKRYGQGTQTWPNGSKYVGGFKDGNKHSQGTYTWPDGSKYVGEWKYGNRYDSSLDKLDWTKSLGFEKKNETLLDKEAFEFVNTIIDQHWLIYGDSWFTISGALIQMKDVSYAVEIQEIKEVDRMNGIEWKGYFYIYPKFTRERKGALGNGHNHGYKCRLCGDKYRDGHTTFKTSDSTWGEWYAGGAGFGIGSARGGGTKRIYRYEVWKIDGKWTFKEVLAKGPCISGWCIVGGLENPKIEDLPDFTGSGKLKEKQQHSTKQFKKNANIDLDLWAVKDGDINKVKHLLDKGANVNTTNIKGDTALLIASWQGHLDIAKTLIDHGADVNLSDNTGQTPLIVASTHGHIGIVKVLLENGAYINAKTQTGVTALIRAILNNHAGIVKVLLEYDAEVNVMDNKGRTALSCAKSIDNTQILQLLRNGNASKIKSARTAKQQYPVYAKNSSNIYHKSNCPELGTEGLMEFASSQKAHKSGGIPCVNCNP